MAGRCRWFKAFVAPVVVAGVIVTWTGPAFGQAAATRFASLEAFRGQASVVRLGAELELVRGLALERNDIVVTRNGTVVVRFYSDASQLRIGADSQVQINESAGERERLGAQDGGLLPGERPALLLGLALDGEEVDANHRSPTRRNARPTATAAVAATSSGAETPNFAASKAMRLNGLNSSIWASNRSPSISAKPSIREVPPDTTTRSM